MAEPSPSRRFRALTEDEMETNVSSVLIDQELAELTLETSKQNARASAEEAELEMLIQEEMYSLGVCSC